MKKLVALLLAVLMVVALFAGCAPKADEPADKPADQPADKPADEPADAPADEPAAEGEFDGVVKIGVDECLTGGGAVYGLPEARAMQIAADEINAAGGVKVDGKSYKIELIQYDNKSDANEAVAALRKLIDLDGVKFITGWATTGSTMAAAQMRGGEDALMRVACAGELSITTQGYPNVLRIRPPGAYTGGPAGEFVYNEGNKTVGILGQFKDSMRSQYNEKFVEAFTGLGGTVVATESFEETDRDMYTQLTKILAEDPDCLFIPGFVEPIAFAVKQARELGFEGPIYGFCGGSREQFLEVLTIEELEGLYDILPVEGNIEALGENAKQYHEKYVNLFGEEPPPNGIYGYDAIYALAAGMEAANSIDDVEAVAEACRNMPVAEGAGMEYLTVGGSMFDPNGQCYTINIVVQWQNGNRVLVEKLESDPTAFSEYMSQLTAETVAAR